MYRYLPYHRYFPVRFILGMLSLWPLFPSLADLVDPAPRIEQEVNWQIGTMRADPLLNQVYLVNETSHKLLALNTDTGEVDFTKVLPDSSLDAQIEFSIDGATLYVSTPETNRIHAYSTADLSYLVSISVPYPVQHFVIGSDGYLYSIRNHLIGQDQLTKIDLSTGEIVDSNTSSSWDHPSLLIRNTTGSRLFVMELNVSGSSAVQELQIQSNAMPSNLGTHFASANSDNDLTFDDGLNTLYRASSNSSGLDISNITTGQTDSWDFGTSVGYAVGYFNGANEIFAAAGNSSEGRIRRFNKSTGAVMFDYPTTGFSSGFENGRVLSNRLEVTSNGHVVYAKIDPMGNNNPNALLTSEFYIGIIGISHLKIPDSPEQDLQPITEVQTTWTIGDMLGDSGRSVVYIVDQTNHKIMALNTETGATSSEVTVPVDPSGGHLALSPDGSNLYLSTPLNSRIYRFVPGENLVLQDFITTPFAIRSFAFGNDGSIYTTNQKLTKINAADGTVLGEVDSPTFSGETLIHRNESGSNLYVMTLQSTRYDQVERFSIVADSLPAIQSGIFDNQGAFLDPHDRDLSIDESRNLMFRANRYSEASVWDLDNGFEMNWPHSGFGAAVTQIPSSRSVFWASQGDTIRQFEKDSAKVIATYTHTELYEAEPIYNKMEMAANEVVIYGKKPFDNDDNFIGVIGVPQLSLPRSGPTSPVNVSASRGTQSDRITITWDSVPNATSYEIYRSVFDQTIPSNPHTTVSGTNSYIDTTVTSNEVHNYWIKAINSHGESLFSEIATGFKASGNPPLTPDGLIASNGAYGDKVRLRWNRSLRYGSYTIYRSTTSGGFGTAIGTTDKEVWDDTTGTPGTVYYYRVRASNPDGNSGYSNHDSGYRLVVVPPEAPDGLTASDHEFPDKIELSWNPVQDANSYSLFRNTQGEGFPKNPLASNIPSNSYVDQSATPGVTYYYWVAALNEGASSPLSAMASGSVLARPSPPLSVEASDGASVDSIEITWAPVPHADTYSVWRGTTQANLSEIANGVTASSFEDTTVPQNTLHYYRIKAFNQAGESNFSQIDSGYAGTLPPEAPTGLNASDGSHPDKISLSWTGVTGADTYHIYRATTNSVGASQLVGTNIVTTNWDDTDFIAGRYYFYWITALNAAGTSDFSNSDRGYVIQNADIPTAVSASDGSYDTHVRITWSPSIHAERYYVFRSVSGGNFSSIGSVLAPTTSFSDFGAGTGSQQAYHVTAWTPTGGQTAPSQADFGFKRLPAPTMIQATDGQYRGEVNVTWTGAPGAASYQVYRATISDGSDRVLVGSTTDTSFTDTSGTPGDRYYYLVSSQDGPNTSVTSQSDEGYGTINAPFQPDNSIGIRPNQKKGDNVYIISKAQEIRKTSKRMRRLRWYITNENDGETNDQFIHTLTRSNKYFKGTLTDMTRGTNVTAAANAGILQNDVTGGQVDRYRLDVKPTLRTRNKRKSRSFLFSTHSTQAPDLFDGVRAKGQTAK